MRGNRLKKIENTILSKGTVSLKELSEVYKVSIHTIRNDVDEIVKRGRAKKVYGGVEAAGGANGLLEYELREDKMALNKEIICKKASKLIKKNDIIFIDSGTTTVYLTNYLLDKENITVVTNNIMVISRLLGNKNNIDIVGLGGKVDPRTKSFASDESLVVLDYYNIDKAFMAATAISCKGGAMHSSSAENSIKKLAMSKASEKYLLIDKTKFNKSALLTYCALSDVDAVITEGCDNNIRKEYNDLGIKIIK